MMLTGRWFPQIVDYKGQWESISNIYITKIVVLVSEPDLGRPSCLVIYVPLLLQQAFVISSHSDFEDD